MWRPMEPAHHHHPARKRPHLSSRHRAPRGAGDPVALAAAGAVVAAKLATANALAQKAAAETNAANNARLPRPSQSIRIRMRSSCWATLRQR